MPKKLKMHGVIGMWWDELDSKSITDKIDGFKPDDDIDVRINSPGGSAVEGIAIYNALKGHPGKVRVIVDALAASSASIIAMAGDEIVMRGGAMMMIHNPWSVTAGDADEHRKSADILDKHRDALTEIYASRTGKSADEINDLLSKETWMTAQEAVDMGFASERADGGGSADDVAAMMAKFEDDLKRFQSVPGELRGRVAAAVKAAQLTTPKGEDMPNELLKEKLEEEAREAREAQIRAEALANERKRISTITDICAKFGQDELAQAMVSEGVSIDKARERVINALAKKGPDPMVNATSSITAGKDARDKFVEGATQALEVRGSARGAKRDPRNEFNGMTLAEIARASTRHNGIDVRGLDKMEMIGKVFASAGMHTRSDFSIILENAALKSVAEGYSENAQAFRIWTHKGSANNFQKFSRVSLGSFSKLDEVPEHGEFHHGTIGAHGQEGKIATYGKLFSISRQAVIDDQLDMLFRIPREMGEAAERTVANLPSIVLASNDPLQDDIPLFDAQHGNDMGNNLLDIDGLKAAEFALINQVDENGKSLSIQPRYLIVPPELRYEAWEIVNNENISMDPGLQKNPFYNRIEVVVDNNLLNQSDPPYWYLAGKPSHTVEVAYLMGRDTPYLETKNGWSIDGVHFKVRIDAGSHALDYRSIVRSTHDS